MHPLVGRDHERRAVQDFLDDSRTRGAALLITGDAGMGKTALLDLTARTAGTTGTRVVRVTGAQYEAEVGFAGLDRLLAPLHQELTGLSATHRRALSVVLRSGSSRPPDRLMVVNATVSLFRQVARNSPLLVVIDDVQWLDRVSAAVFAFVARRMTGTRAGLLVAARPESDRYFGDAGLPTIDLEPLDEGSSAKLVKTRFPALAEAAGRRVLAEAAGNPLALVELPAVLTLAQSRGAEAIPNVLPLNARLGNLFAARIAGLPPETRDLLLVAALHGSGELPVIQAAARAVGGIAPLGPAERTGLVSVRSQTHQLVFRHPLVRSTVVEAVGAADRRRAHRALADAVADQPERRAWHLAEATTGQDERVAALLEEISNLALKRGDATGAVTALTRAAELSQDSRGRGRRLAQAAYLGADVTGTLTNASALLDSARVAESGPVTSLQAAVAGAYLLLNGDGAIDKAHRLLVGALETHAAGNHPDADIGEALHALLLVCFFGGRVELWQPFDTVLARVGEHVPETVSLCASTLRDPARSSPQVLDRLAEVITALPRSADPTHIVRTGMAAFYVDRVSACREPLWRVVANGRAGGAVASGIDALAQLCFEHMASGRWDEARQLADESVEQCVRHGYLLLQWPCRLGQALLAAARDDSAFARGVADQMTAWAAARGVRIVEDYARHIRTVAAIGDGDFEAAYQEATGISAAGELLPSRAHALWVLLDVVESAMRTGRDEQARAHVTAMRTTGLAAVSSRLALVCAGCDAVAAEPTHATGLYLRALSLPDAGLWPFELARIQLCFGEHLRRMNATAESRSQLRNAYDTFERLGARPWATRAAAELRAAGVAVGAPGAHGAVDLTPQDMQIVTLAAAGLTNKQIARQLHVSHRTVGGRLYHLYPKLGVTSRAALTDALAKLRQNRSQVNGATSQVT
ncbi:MAG TPA: AAA family ATPase [Actinoplanes sp.]